MICWLLSLAQSATSLVSLIVGILVLLFLRLPFIHRERVGTYAIVAGLVILSFQLAFDVSATFLKVLGKDPTLTDRTQIWHDVLQVPINPVLGAGFESFWLGQRREKMWENWFWHPNQAHNGYLETYLNLGGIGLFLLIGLLMITFWKARREFLANSEFSRFRLGFLAIVLVYNWTEASFKALHLVFFVFFIIAIDSPKPLLGPGQNTVEEASPEEESEPLPAAARAWPI
jgi:O-antigen ligase